jgi:hypothetical protein
MGVIGILRKCNLKNTQPKGWTPKFGIHLSMRGFSLEYTLQCGKYFYSMRKTIRKTYDTQKPLIEKIGVGYQHDSSFIINRPKGLGSYLFLHFLTHVKALTRNGIVEAVPGDCLIYGPEDPQLYHGNGGGLGNDWLHANSKRFGALVESFNIPVGTLMRPGRTDFIASLMTEMSHEVLHERPFSGKMLELLTEKLLLELARQLKEKSNVSFTPRKLELLNKFSTRGHPKAMDGSRNGPTGIHEPEQVHRAIQGVTGSHLRSGNKSCLKFFFKFDNSLS